MTVTYKSTSCGNGSSQYHFYVSVVNDAFEINKDMIRANDLLISLLVKSTKRKINSICLAIDLAQIGHSDAEIRLI